MNFEPRRRELHARGYIPPPSARLRAANGISRTEPHTGTVEASSKRYLCKLVKPAEQTIAELDATYRNS
jgi:hypothetical protein